MITKRSMFAIAVIALATLIVAPAAAQDPYEKPNNSWITISGTVSDVSADTFTLNYGDGAVTVEMDDWDLEAEGYNLVNGDEVVVTGIIDDDFFEMTTIEASSVFVEGLNTYFYASPADEEDSWTATMPIEVSETTIVGTVTAVGHHEFTVDSAVREFRVDVSDMPYDPLDDEGFQKIEVGDRVRVSGDLELTFFEGRELMAESVITLSNGVS